MDFPSHPDYDRLHREQAHRAHRERRIYQDRRPQAENDLYDDDDDVFVLGLFEEEDYLRACAEYECFPWNEPSEYPEYLESATETAQELDMMGAMVYFTHCDLEEYEQWCEEQGIEKDDASNIAAFNYQKRETEPLELFLASAMDHLALHNAKQQMGVAMHLLHEREDGAELFAERMERRLEEGERVEQLLIDLTAEQEAYPQGAGVGIYDQELDDEYDEAGPALDYMLTFKFNFDPDYEMLPEHEEGEDDDHPIAWLAIHVKVDAERMQVENPVIGKALAICLMTMLLVPQAQVHVERMYMQALTEAEAIQPGELSELELSMADAALAGSYEQQLILRYEEGALVEVDEAPDPVMGPASSWYRES